MLILNDLVVNYGPDPVIRSLNLTLKPGMVHGLMGVNGAGKTTLLNTLYGLIMPASGTLAWQGRPLTAKDIGYLESENYFYPYITGREYLELFRLQNPGFDLKGWLQVMPLPLDRPADEYSTGMKKKLALLAVLCLDRPVLVLDEPFNGLDLESSHLLKNILQALAKKGKLVLITSHILESLLSLAEEIHYLREGEIIHTYLPAEYAGIEQDVLQAANADRLKGLDDIMSK